MNKANFACKEYIDVNEALVCRPLNGSLMPSQCAPPDKKWSGEASQIF